MTPSYTRGAHQQKALSGAAVAVLWGLSACGPNVSPSAQVPTSALSNPPPPPELADGAPVYVHQILPPTVLLSEAEWSPDGRVIALSFRNMGLFVLDGETGYVRAEIPDCATQLHFSADSKRLVWLNCTETRIQSVIISGKVEVAAAAGVTLTTQPPILSIPIAEGGPPSTFAVTRTCDYAAVISGGYLHVVSLSGASTVAAVTLENSPAKLAFSPSGSELGIAFESGIAGVVSLKGEWIWQTTLKNGTATGVGFSNDGSNVAFGGENEYGLYTAKNGIPLPVDGTPCEEGQVAEITFSADDQFLLATCVPASDPRKYLKLGEEFSRARMHRAIFAKASGKEVRSLGGSFFEPSRLSFDRSGKRAIVTGSRDASVLSLPEGSSLFQVPTPTMTRPSIRVVPFVNPDASAALLNDLIVSTARVEWPTSPGRAAYPLPAGAPPPPVSRGLRIANLTTQVETPIVSEDSFPVVNHVRHHVYWDRLRDRTIWSFTKGNLQMSDQTAVTSDDKWLITDWGSVTEAHPGIAKWHEREGGDTHDPKEFGVSPKGTYIVAMDTFEQRFDQRLRAALVLWTLSDNKVHMRVNVGFGRMKWAMTQDEKRVAATSFGSGLCYTAPDPTCYQALVFDVATKRKVISINAVDSALSPLAFSDDGRFLVLGNGVHEVATGKVVFQKTGANGKFHSFLPGTNTIVVLNKAGARLVDVQTGAERANIPGITALLDTSADGRFLLFSKVTEFSSRRSWSRESQWLLFDTKTNAVTILPLFQADPEGPTPFLTSLVDEPAAGTAQRTAPNIVVLPTETRVVLYRIDDGRILYRYGVKNPLFVTDQGVFDGDESVWQNGAFRMGPDIARQRLSSVSGLKNELHHPGLLIDFLSAK